MLFFLKVKLMNGEKAAFLTPTFALKRQRTLDTLIRDIYTEHCTDHKVVSNIGCWRTIWKMTVITYIESVGLLKNMGHVYGVSKY